MVFLFGEQNRFFYYKVITFYLAKLANIIIVISYSFFILERFLLVIGLKRKFI